MSDFRKLKNDIVGIDRRPDPDDPNEPRTASDRSEVAPSSRRMHVHRGEPIYSHEHRRPGGSSDPAWSSPIEPGPNEGRSLQPGPTFLSSVKAGTQPMNLPNKSDAKNVGKRGKPVTY